MAAEVTAFEILVGSLLMANSLEEEADKFDTQQRSAHSEHKTCGIGIVNREGIYCRQRTVQVF